MVKNSPRKGYRKDISLPELFRMFPDNNASQAWLEDQRWGGEPWCPHCGSFNIKHNNHPSMPWRCAERECRKKFSVRVGTPLYRSPLGYQTWVIAIYLLTTSLKSVSSMKLHRDLDITQKTAWFLAHRIRQSFEDCGESDLFSGPIKVNETYVGGKWANMSNTKRKELTPMGRDPADKTAVVGLKGQKIGQVRTKVVESTDKLMLQGFVTTHTGPDATVYTDDALTCEGLPSKHESAKHSVREFVREQAHTNGVESFWLILKRTFHKLSPKHLDWYVQEFATKHNLRECDTQMQMNAVVHRMEGRKLRYTDLDLSGTARA